MPKSKFDYAKEDVIRGGDELIGAEKDNAGLYLIMIRQFDTARGGMSDWVIRGSFTDEEDTNAAAWIDCVNKMRSGGIMAAVNVKVNRWWETDREKHPTLDKWNVMGTVMEARSSHMLRGNGGTSKFTAPGAWDLYKAVVREVNLYLESTDQSKDDAAKDIAHDTSNVPFNQNVDNIDETLERLAPAVPTGDTGSAFETQQNAQHNGEQNGETVEHATSGRKSRKRNRE